MKRTALFTLLVALSAAWSIPAKAQSPGVAEYARQSTVAAKKQTAKKEAKKTNEHFTISVIHLNSVESGILTDHY
jgi:Zn-dependent membrane protease YugP